MANSSPLPIARLVVAIVESETQRAAIDPIRRHDVAALGVEPLRYDASNEFPRLEQVSVVRTFGADRGVD